MSFPRRTYFAILLLMLVPYMALAGVVTVPFKSGTAEMVTTPTGTVLTIPGFSSMSSPGNPQLPSISTYVLLPPNADIKSIKVEIKNPVEQVLPDAYSIAPTPPMASYDKTGKEILSWGSANVVDGKNVDIYGKDEFYPNNYATKSFSEKLNTYKLLPITFWPYKYNPATGTILHLISGDVVVSFNDLKTTQSIAGDAFSLGKLKDLAENWQDAGQWYRTTALQESTPIPLAIITTSTIVNGSSKFADYVAHKTAMGYSVTVATEADWGGGTANAAAENIKAWLKANYQTKARYALLIGNPDPMFGDVPMKMLWPRNDAPDSKDAPSDYYYADMNGNWDLDGDGYYGEEIGDFGEGGIDRIPEVIVGRIPFYNNNYDSTFVQLDKILQKIINFETTTEVGPWAQRMLIPMKPLDGNTPGWHLGEQIKNNVAIPSNLNYFRIYEENYGLTPNPEMIPCLESTVAPEWKNGYGYVFWSTHGAPNYASSIMSTWLAQELDDTKPSFVVQGSCSNGEPEYSNNLGYALLINGAIATVSATRYGWYWPGQTDFTNTESMGGMEYGFAYSLINNKMKCGDAAYAMKTRVTEGLWPNHVVYNLYGDPTVAPRQVTTPLSVDTSTLKSGMLNESYTTVLQASGSEGPYSWSYSGGVLPNGMSVTANGLLTGTPKQSGVYNFTVTVTDSHGATATKDLTLEVRMVAASFPLDTDPGWTREGMWGFGQTQGKGSSYDFSYDPLTAHTGTNVYGYNLAGPYPPSMTKTEYLTTTAIDCSKWTNVKLSFWRWLAVDWSAEDNATIDVSTDGINWTSVWNCPAGTIDTYWNQVTYDISSVADRQSKVYIRWGMGPTNDMWDFMGWNIDDVEIIGDLAAPLITHNQTMFCTDATSGTYEILTDVLCSTKLLSSNPIIHWSTGGEYSSSTMTFVSGNTYRGYIPAQPVGSTIKYYFSAEDANAKSTSPSDAPEKFYKIDVIVDTVPPVIVHTPLPNTTDTVGPYKVYATVTDNVGVSTVKLLYSKNGSATVTTVTMTKTDKPNEWYAKINGLASAGTYFTYKIVATDSSQSHNQATNPQLGSYMFSIIPNTLTKVYSFPLDIDPGWSREGLWAFGVPTGHGSNSTDPTSGYTGRNVFGYNLDGDYPEGLTKPDYLTTTAIDCTNITNTTLKFWRWLAVDSSYADHASVEASSNKNDWTLLWNNPAGITIVDNAWSLQTFPMNTIADGKHEVFIRWGMGPTDNDDFYLAGWNIDDVEIWGKVFPANSNLTNVKSLANNTTLALRGKVVSACYTGYFYAEDPVSRQGIRVAWPYPIAEGTPVTVFGSMRTRAGEREIVAESVQTESTLSAIKPLIMTCKSLGGAATGLQQGIMTYLYGKDQVGTPKWLWQAATGLNNIGTLVKISGKITQIDTAGNYFYVNDGSEVKDATSTGTTANIGVRVAYPSAGLSAGQFVTVTGVSSGFLNTKNELLRQILPRRASDIVK